MMARRRKTRSIAHIHFQLSVPKFSQNLGQELRIASTISWNWDPV